MQAQQLVLISGIPGTGKSRFAEWLRDHHEFVLYETDKHGGKPPSTEWIFQQRQLVVEWGFPANEPSLSICIGLIKSWVDGGVSHWWFDGDRGAARTSFLNRGTVPATSRGMPPELAWSLQVNEINRNWPTIGALFPPERRLGVIEAGPTYLPAQEIFAAISS
jgi:hypothetical protein